MSGGHWDYSGHRIQNAIEAIAQDEAVREMTPILADVLAALADVLYDVEHDLDWHLSGDSSIGDASAFERRAVGRVLDAVLKALPDDDFDRGKWATIQAWQARLGVDR